MQPWPGRGLRLCGGGAAALFCTGAGSTGTAINEEEAWEGFETAWDGRPGGGCGVPLRLGDVGTRGDGCGRSAVCSSFFTPRVDSSGAAGAAEGRGVACPPPAAWKTGQIHMSHGSRLSCAAGISETSDGSCHMAYGSVSRQMAPIINTAMNTTAHSCAT